MKNERHEEFTFDPGSQEMLPMEFMRDCPACGIETPTDREDCAACGIVFSKWREPRPLSMRGMGDARSHQSSDKGSGLLLKGLFSVLALAAIGFAVWFFVLRPQYATVGPPIGQGDKTVILMHDFGTPAKSMVPRAEALSARLPAITWVMPAGPHGARGGSAWVVGPDEAQLRATAKESAMAVRGLLAELTEKGVDPSTVYLGGYAQGALVALDVALASDAPDIAGLILLNGGIPNWPDANTLKNQALKAGTRVFIAHGRNDTIVPITQAARMRAQLFEAGIAVKFHTAVGGHGIAASALDALAEWLGGDAAQ